jgi:XTP/dITP diphosphohydrolase
VTSSPFLLATRSTGKLRELRELFERAGVVVLDLDAAGIPEQPEEEELEVFDTFEENALAKARYFYRRAGMAVVADDSGLEVFALGGRPGVRSKRWSGRTDLTGQALDDANNERLLKALGNVSDRRGRYVCVAALVAGASERTFRGETVGRVLDHPKGTGGFGYDPYFFSDDLGKTFAEAGVEEKERVSHRGRAFQGLLTSLRSHG